jgi:hypothetical protein
MCKEELLPITTLYYDPVTRETRTTRERYNERYPDYQILTGYRTGTVIDSGYYYCPYIPDLNSVESNTVNPPVGKGFLSKYAPKLLKEAAKYYGKS